MVEVIEQPLICLRAALAGVYLCVVKTDDMKQFIKQLFFDQELVNSMKQMRPDHELLYVQLMSGKITMKEYIAAGKR